MTLHESPASPQTASGPVSTHAQIREPGIPTCPPANDDSSGLDLLGQIGGMVMFGTGCWFYSDGIRDLPLGLQWFAWSAPSAAILVALGCAWLLRARRSRTGRRTPRALSAPVMLLSMGGMLCNLVPVLFGGLHCFHLGEYWNLGWFSFPVGLVAGVLYAIVTGLGQFLAGYLTAEWANGAES